MRAVGTMTTGESPSTALTSGSGVQFVAPTAVHFTSGQFDCTTGTWNGFAYEGDRYDDKLPVQLVPTRDEPAGDEPGRNDNAISGDGFGDIHGSVNVRTGDVCVDTFAGEAMVQQPESSPMRFFHDSSQGITVCNARTMTVTPTSAQCSDGRATAATVADGHLWLVCETGKASMNIQEYTLDDAGHATAYGHVEVAGIRSAIGRGGFLGNFTEVSIGKVLPAN